MFVAGSRLAFDYNAFGTHTILESGPLVLGNRDLSIHLRRGDGMSGTAAIAVDGEHAGAVALRLFMRMMSSIGPRIGSDHGSPVAQRYDSPFAFTGVLHEVVIQASPEYFGDTRAVEGRAEESRQ
jgi:arylsulfatase